VLLPGLSPLGLVSEVTLAKTSVLLANRGKASGLSVLVDSVGDPVDSGVSSDSLVRRVNKDDLVVLVDTVLVDPVRVKDSEVTASSTNSLLSGRSESSLELEVVDSVSDGLTEGSSLLDGLLPVTPSDSNSVDKVALLGLVSESTSLVGSRRSGSSVNDSELSVLPAPDPHEEPHDIRLLLLVKLRDISVGTHLDCLEVELYQN